MNTDAKKPNELPPLPDPPWPLTEARDKVIEAFNSLFYLMRCLESSAWRDGHSRGWSGHHEWVQEQFKKIQEEVAAEAAAAAEQAKTTAEAMKAAAVTHDLGHGVLRTPHHDSETRATISKPAADVVYEVIEQHPGLTGVEIVRHLQKVGTPINERTIRTALFRLKVDKIASVKGRWYTKGEATRVVQELANVKKERELIL